MQLRGFFLAVAATFVHLGCAAPSRVRHVVVRSAPTRLLAADVLPDLGAELVTLHDDALAVHAFTTVEASPRTETVELPSTPRDVVQLDGSTLVVAHQGRTPPSLVVRTNAGWTVTPLPAGERLVVDRLLAGDIDGNGSPDLVRLGRPPVRIDVSTTPPSWLPLTPTPRVLPSGTLVDIDRDGDTDIVCALATGDPDVAVPDHLRVFRTGRGGLLDETWYPAPGVRFVDAGDLDGNGTPELVAFGPSGTWVLTNLGRGWFSAARRISRRPVRAGRVGDIDGDGRLDLATLHPDGIRVRLGKGAGQFRAAARVDLPGSAPDLEILPRPDGVGWLVTADPIADRITLTAMLDHDGASARTSTRRTTTLRRPTAEHRRPSSDPAPPDR